ncbi:MAG: capsule biosynthesis protein, partial [Nitrospirae bacterium]|nr:capsule biosynthesis protein [Nitrospirota bacterium]
MKKTLNSILKRTARMAVVQNAGPWQRLIENEPDLWNIAKQKAGLSKRVLIATSTGCYDHAVILESALSAALTLRGTKVDILLCDNFLPCCMMTKISNVSPEALLSQDHTPRCKACHQNGKTFFGELGLHIYGFGELVSKSDLEKAENISQEILSNEIGDYKFSGMAVGEHALAGALRYFARGDLNSEPFGEKILRRYLKASLLTAFTVTSLLKRNKYDAAVFHHGIYVPQGIIGEVCRKEGVHVVNWNPSYRKQTFIFSHDDSYHHTMITEPVSEWENIRWTKEMEKTTLDYLKSRWHGTEDWIWFHEKPVEDVNRIGRELGLDFSRPCIGMLTSVMWDAQLHYRSNAFENMLDWVLQSIDYFSRRQDLQLIIRVHPAEVRGMVPSRQKIVDEIKRICPDLPGNIFIIPPESRISTYAIMEKCN